MPRRWEIPFTPFLPIFFFFLLLPPLSPYFRQPLCNNNKKKKDENTNTTSVQFNSLNIMMTQITTRLYYFTEVEYTTRVVPCLVSSHKKYIRFTWVNNWMEQPFMTASICCHRSQRVNQIYLFFFFFSFFYFLFLNPSSSFFVISLQVCLDSWERSRL